jgi:DNA-binding response OmpR family regulator
VLYVEDEPLISLDAMSVLETCDFRNLHCAYTLKSAIEASYLNDFDCAILDIHLDKGLSSIDLAHNLAERGTMIILASGNGMDQSKLKSLGFEHFFIKPYDIKHIVSHIEHHFL